MKRLQDPRIWLIGGALTAVLMVAISYLMFIQPKLSSAADLNDQAVASREANDLLQVRTASLEAKSTKLTRYTSSLKAALASLPYDSGLPAFTRQLNTQAKSNGVRVTSVVVGGVTPVVPSAPAASAPGSASGATSPVPATSAAGDLFSLLVTVQSEGSLTNQLAFLRTVRTIGPRQALITGTQVAPAPEAKATSVNRASSFTTQMSIFVAPRSPEQIRQLTKLASGDLER